MVPVRLNTSRSSSSMSFSSFVDCILPPATSSAEPSSAVFLGPADAECSAAGVCPIVVRSCCVVTDCCLVQAFQKRYFCRLWSETMARAGIETVHLPDFKEPVRLHFHDLRGTSVTLLAEAGCTVPEIATITGHNLETVTRIIERYLKLIRGLADHAISKFEKSKKTKFAMRLRVTARKAVSR